MSSPSELAVYVGRIRQFGRNDWMVYTLWVGMMLGLVASTGGFLMLGHHHGVLFPASAWLVPIGATIFAVAIAIDTIGHRTIYKEVLRGGEAMVHHITIFCGVGSCVMLCLAHGVEGAWIPAAVLTALSFVYSLIDEAFHWRRYSSGDADRVEMWSHLFIFVGHGIMMLGWWAWYAGGYLGVDATLRAMGGP